MIIDECLRHCRKNLLLNNKTIEPKIVWVFYSKFNK